MAAGDPSRALLHLKRACELAPARADYLERLASALARHGFAAEAIAAYRAMLARAPDSVVPLNELAWILATQPDPALRRPEEALQLAQRASELTRRRSASVLDTLAAAHAAAGQFEQAREEADLALELAASSPAELAGEIAERLALYRRNLPYRSSTATADGCNTGECR